MIRSWSCRSQNRLKKSIFKEHSELKFKHEYEKAKSLVFLDTVVSRLQTDFHTAVYTKDFNAGDYKNYKSACQERYKVAVIDTLLHRGYHVSSDWTTFDLEIKSIEQLLGSNNFPMKLISSVITKFIKEKFEQSVWDNKIEKTIFIQKQITSNYKMDDRILL